MSDTLRFLGTALKLALTVLAKNPARSLLTAFGLLVGVFAVTVVVSLGEGASRAIDRQMSSLGTATLDISPRARGRSGIKSADAPEALTESDARALAGQASAVARAAPIMDSLSRAVYRDANVSTPIKGTTTSFFRIRDWKPAYGSLWTPGAEREKERVCVLGKVVADELFGPEDPVGRVIRIGRYPFTVLGVLEEKGTVFGRDMDDRVVIPIGTFRGKLEPALPGQVHRIVAQANAPELVDRAKRQVVGILRQRHGLAEGAPNDFRVSTQRRFRETQEQVLGVLRLLLVGIAAVSLLVGGIGVMNIMLVSVTERTREIGIRMAIGAREWHIRWQFLIEAVVLCLLGGLAGALVAIGSVEVLAKVLELPMRVSPGALVAALVTSTAIGVFFGFLPAKRAARLDPIEALRSEA